MTETPRNMDEGSQLDVPGDDEIRTESVPRHTWKYGDLYALLFHALPHYRTKQGRLDRPRIVQETGLSQSTLTEYFNTDYMNNKVAFKLWKLCEKEAEKTGSRRVAQEEFLPFMMRPREWPSTGRPATEEA